LKPTGLALFIASVITFLIALFLPFEKDTHAMVPTWWKFLTGWWFLLTGQSSVWFVMPLLILSWIAHFLRAHKTAFVFSLSGFLLALPYLNQPILKYGWTDSIKTLTQIPQAGYYLLLVSLILQMVANLLETLPGFSKNNRSMLISLVSCAIGVAIIVSAPSFLYKSAQVAVKASEPKPLPPVTNFDELYRQALPPHHYQSQNDIPHGPPGTVPNGLKTTVHGSELVIIENTSNGTLNIRAWYTQKTPSGELLTCHLVAQKKGAKHWWETDIDLGPKATVSFTDQYARLVSRGQCNHDLNAAKLEYVVIAKDVNTHPYHFLTDTVFWPLPPPNAQKILPYWYTNSLGVADTTDAISNLAKREQQIRQINNPWAMNPLNGGNDQKERDAIGKIAHAPAGETPSWLTISRQGQAVQVTNMNELPIKLRLWFSLTRSDGQSIKCELGTLKDNTPQFLSPALSKSASATFDKVFAHPHLLAECEQAFDQAKLELAVSEPNPKRLITKYLFISDGVFSPSPPPNATSITFH
jgi:hypothetical protein